MSQPLSTRTLSFAVHSVSRILGKKTSSWLVRMPFRLVSIIGTATGIPYLRFVGLKEAAEAALDRGNATKADRLAAELLALAERYRDDFNYGNAIHHGNKVRGLCALRAGRISQAEDYLRASGHSPGSPQLNSFGPSMRLASALLEYNARQAVLEYLEACKEFWQIAVRLPDGRLFTGRAQLDQWAEAIRENNVPDFRPNIGY